MDDDRKLSQPDSEKETRPKKEHTFLKRFGVLCLTLLVVLGAVTVALLGEGRYLDRVRRWLVYGDSTEENLYAYAADEHNRYGQIGDFLVVLNQNFFQLLEDDGTAYLSEQVQLSSPALDVGGELAVAYDVGGQNLYLFSQEGELLHLTMEEDYGLISAHVNESGYLAVVAEESGYKGAVTVYNDQQERLFAYHSSSQFLVDAVVSEDCDAVTVAALGQSGEGFCTDLIRYRLTETESSADASLTDHLSLEMDTMGDGCVSVSDSGISFTDAAGNAVGNFTYGGLYLRDYTVGGEDFAALLLNRYRSGSIGTLVSVGADGQAIAMLNVTEEVLDVSAAGEYVAVLYSDTLVIYHRDLTEYSRLEGTNYASHVLMDADGSALVIGSNSAYRYLP